MVSSGGGDGDLMTGQAAFALRGEECQDCRGASADSPQPNAVLTLHLDIGKLHLIDHQFKQPSSESHPLSLILVTFSSSDHE